MSPAPTRSGAAAAAADGDSKEIVPGPEGERDGDEVRGRAYNTTVSSS